MADMPQAQPAQDAHPDAELPCHLRISALLERWAACTRAEFEAETDQFEAEYLRGYAQALLDSAMHLREGDGFFGEVCTAA